MPRLYLFRITKLSNSIGRRVAILTKVDKDPELSKINQGEKTGYFDEHKLATDGVDYKGSIEVSEEAYNNVIKQMEKVGKNPNVAITAEGGKISIIINKEVMNLVNFPTRSRTYVEYPFVFIKG